MKSSLKGVCAKCSNNIRKSFVSCNICQSKFHRPCAHIEDDSVFNVLQKYKNIVFNCERCLNAKQNLADDVANIKNDIKDLKLLLLNDENISSSKSSKFCRARGVGKIVEYLISTYFGEYL